MPTMICSPRPFPTMARQPWRGYHSHRLDTAPSGRHRCLGAQALHRSECIRRRHYGKQKQGRFTARYIVPLVPTKSPAPRSS